MAEVLARWDDFWAGHWGALGPRLAQGGSLGPRRRQYISQNGGVNMQITNQGNLRPVNSSRWLQLGTTNNGKVWSIFWNWGGDGRVYYAQQGDSTHTTTFKVRRFTPDPLPANLPNAVSDMSGTITATSFTYAPDWYSLGQNAVYVTIWGDKTYVINVTNGTIVKQTGSYGDAPAGRCITLYGDRLLVGGTNDTRFGSQPNRVVFSGDDTGNNPTDRSAWETANYFDIGSDGINVVGLYPIRDYCVAIMEDQTIWVITGTPNANISLRKMYGFHKSNSAISVMQPHHAHTDPSQARVWMYDHNQRGPARFNGASFSRVSEFGTPSGNRIGALLINGSTAPIGGPDEFIMHGVAMPRSAGLGVVGKTIELLHIAGAFALVQSDVIAARHS